MAAVLFSGDYTYAIGVHMALLNQTRHLHIPILKFTFKNGKLKILTTQT